MQTRQMTRSFVESTKPTPHHVYLNLENITGTGTPGDFKVYVYRQDNENRVRCWPAYMTTFGLERASNPEPQPWRQRHQSCVRHHGAGGPSWPDGGHGGQVQVRFEREGLAATEEAVPLGLEELRAARLKRGSAVKVGRVSVYYD